MIETKEDVSAHTSSLGKRTFDQLAQIAGWDENALLNALNSDAVDRYPNSDTVDEPNRQIQSR